jgi:hypothetical protein
VGGTRIAHRGDEKCLQSLVGNPEGNDFEDLGMDGMIILRNVGSNQELWSQTNRRC